MKVKEFVETMSRSCKVVFVNSEEDEICHCDSQSEGVKPYYDREVIRWRVSNLWNTTYAIVIVIRGEGNEDNKNQREVV